MKEYKRLLSYGGVALLGVVCLIATGMSIYFFMQYKKSQELLKSPTVQAQMQSQAIITKVGALMELPTDEVPTIATVSDAAKLKDQAFFLNAKNGDEVLIYVKAKEAILYRPSENKIVAVGPINVNASVTPAPQNLAPTRAFWVQPTAVPTVGQTSAPVNSSPTP